MENNYDEVINSTPKITNGSMLIIGDFSQRSLNIVVNKHFNWFQKKMIQLCFGFKVVNYHEK